MKELYESIKSWVSERMSSPFFAALIMSWLFYNWEPLFLILCNKGAATETIRLVRLEYWQGFFSLGISSCRLHIFPAITALVWVALYPHLGRWLYEYARWTDSLFKSAQLNWDKKTPISGEERDRLFIDIAEAEERAQEKFGAIADENKRLRETNRALLEELAGKKAGLEQKGKAEASPPAAMPTQPKLIGPRPLEVNRDVLERKIRKLATNLQGVKNELRTNAQKFYAPNKLIWLQNRITRDEGALLELLPNAQFGEMRLRCDEIASRAEVLFGSEFDGAQLAANKGLEEAKLKKNAEFAMQLDMFLLLCSQAIEGLRTAAA